MGTSVIGNPDSQVWKILGIDAEDKKDKGQKNSGEDKKDKGQKNSMYF